MTEDFERVPRVIETHRGDFLGYAEELKTKRLRTLLNEAGIACSLNTSGKGADILGKDFVIEAKNDLLSSSVLQKLKGQVDGYAHRCQQIGVVIYGNASQTFLDELKSFTAGYWPTDIRVWVVGRVVGGTSGNGRLPPSNDTTEWLFGNAASKGILS